MTLSGTEPRSLVRGSVFRYQSFAVDAERGVLSCRYELDGREFTERVTLAPGPRWHTEAARSAARLVFLLAGVSYYKTAAPPVVDFGETALTDAEHGFLREFYLQGLGEFAYRNALDLTSLCFLGGTIPPDPSWERFHTTVPSHAGRWCRSAAGSTRSSRWSRSAGSRTQRCSW